MTDLTPTLEMAVAHYGFAMPDTFEITQVDETKQTFMVKEGYFFTEFEYYFNNRGEIINITELYSYSIDIDDMMEDLYSDTLDKLDE